MKLNKKLYPLIVSLLMTASCSANIPAIPVPAKIFANSLSQEVKPVAPKISLKIKKAEIQVSQKDLNEQLAYILSESQEKRIQEPVLTILPDNKIRVDGKIAQKLPFSDKLVRIPFTMEGLLSVQAGNMVKFEPLRIKVAGITVKAMMELIGLELSELTKFKDQFGRIELKGNNIFLIIEKFTDDVKIEGQMNSLKTENNLLTVIF